MARRAEDRYPSLDALIDELLPFMPEEPALPGAPPEPTQRDAEPFAGSQSTQTLAILRDAAPAAGGTRVRRLVAALVVVVAASGAWWLRPSDSSGVQAARATSPAVLSAKPAPATAEVGSAAGSAAAGAGSAAERASAAPADRAAGADTPATPSSPRSARFKIGWVYLGDYDDGKWVTRYFDGWSQGLPARGTRLRARGRSYVRGAVPNSAGVLAGVDATVGPDDPVELLDLARWEGGSLVWARVRSAW